MSAMLSMLAESSTRFQKVRRSASTRRSTPVLARAVGVLPEANAAGFHSPPSCRTTAPRSKPTSFTSDSTARWKN